MKTLRHRKILEIIADNVVTTQEELLERLATAEFPVTQATISRDIKELHLIKTQNKNGDYCYAKPEQPRQNGDSTSFKTIYGQAVLGIDFAENIVVIRCKVGMANAVCVSLDNLHWNGLVGTISGDDTIFVLMRNKSFAEEFVAQLNKIVR